MPDESAYISMFCRLFDDLQACVPDYTQREADRDRSYALKRVRAEGMEFLVKTLPNLGKHMDASFGLGTFEPHPAFAREKGRTTPNFLRVLFKAVFEDCGTIRVNPCPDAVGHIRQLCFMYYKLEDEYAPELVDKVINDFVNVDVELDKIDLGAAELRPVIIEAKKVIEKVFYGFDPMDIQPRPGPGASASGTPKYLRYEMLTRWDSVHQVYPFYEYFFVNRRHLTDRVSAYKRAPRRSEPVSRLRLVPKDSRGPRIICMEEQELMFLQQGLADKMRNRIETHPLTRGRVNFRDQEVNRQLAKHASYTCLSYAPKATLDMKEASDRVSRELVSTLFSGLPLLKRALLSLSTRRIELPSGVEICSNKFAPMGSSLCFPIMSIVHFAIGTAVMKLQSGRSYKALAESYHVYGDDLIVDTEYVGSFFEWFPKFGMKFNQGKSFVQGPFRESCGYDAFLGKNVSPQRVKKRFFDSADPRLVVAGLDCEGHLHARGYTRTAEYLRTVIAARRFGTEVIPFVPYGSGVLGWRRQSDECDLSSLKSRRNYDLQCLEFRARVIETVPTMSMAGTWERLMRFFSGAMRSQKIAGAHDQLSIRWAWVPVSSFPNARLPQWQVTLC